MNFYEDECRHDKHSVERYWFLRYMEEVEYLKKTMKYHETFKE